MKQLILFLAVALIALSACQPHKEITIYCVGDSTMANKKAKVYPETGWCQVVGNCCNDMVSIHNHAVNGRSSKSFIDEGRWQTVLDSLQKGDYVFIQFGHNDQKDYDSTRYTTPFGSYSHNLVKFVSESRSKGATPILFTSIVRRKFGEDGKLVDTHGDYPNAMRKVAKEENVALIDLQVLTKTWVNLLGDEPSKKMYLWTAPSEQFPDGRKDNTHLCTEGANKVAQLATESISELIPELGREMN